MKPLFCLVFSLLMLHNLYAQSKWQQQTNYDIVVELNDSLKLLKGNISLEYFNNSPDTLNYLWMHIWPNAFSNDKTDFAVQSIRNGKSDFYFSDSIKRGFITDLNFTQNNQDIHYEFHPNHIDIIKVYLLEPILPNQKTNIKTPFLVKLPFNFSRGGYNKNSFQITQWYPKAAMYDQNGWHLYPYLEIGEYFNNFGSYNVTINIPKNYVVAATGLLQNSIEKEWLKNKKDTILKENPSTTPYKSLTYKQDSIIDFAWFADPEFIVDFDTIQLNNKTVEAWVFYKKNYHENWKNAVDIIKSTVHFKSNNLGEYPYPVVSVVQSALGFSGGMEYPTITNISTTYSSDELRKLIKHEVGHNWFQAILASDERTYPWMDEGINSYYDNRYLQEYENEVDNFTRSLYLGLIKTKFDQPINTPAPDFSELNFSLYAYDKAADWLALIENKIGRNTFDSIMKQYYQDWKFNHPQPEDFKKYFDQLENFDSDYYFSLINKTGKVDIQKKKDLKLFFFYKNDLLNKTNIFISPSIGFNHYDKFMLGVAMHNYQIPNPNLNFLITPLFSFSNNSVNGLARLSYTFRGKHFGEKWLVSTDFNKFSNRRGIDSNLNKIAGEYYKIAPGIRYVFPEKSAFSSIRKWIEFKSFFIGEKNFEYQPNHLGDYYPTITDWKNRNINRLTIRRENHHVINPNQTEIQIMQGKEFVRLQATFKGNFNYEDKGFFSYRIAFAGFNYIGGFTSQKYFNTSAFHPKLTASRGWEDLTYSNYFFGRNESDGLWSKQILERDGFMKLRTDIFSNLQGRSDQWIAAINLSTSLPKKIIPLRFLRVFLDIGTYSQSWKSTQQQPNLLYVGGVQLNLVKNVIEVYIPLVYSKIFRDNLKTLPDTKGIGKNISFIFNLQNLSQKQVLNIPPIL